MAEVTDLQRLVVSLEARLDKYNSAMAKLQGQTASTLGSVERRFIAAESRIAKFGSTISRSLGAFGLGYGVLQGLREIGSAVDKIAELGELAGRIGVTTDALQALHDIGVKTGASIEEIDKGLQSIAEQSAEKGSFLDKLFQANNLKVSPDTEANLRHVMDLLKNTGTEADRLFIATKLFGDKVGRQIVEAFSQGGDAIEATRARLQASGKLLTDQQIKEADAIRQKFREVSEDIGLTWDKMALGMIDALQKIGDKLAPLILKFLDITTPDIAAPARRGIPLTKKELDAVPHPGGGFVDRVIGAESGGNTNAKNPLSTATGLGQFIESTWIEQFTKVFPEQAKTMSREAILAMRTDARTSRALIENYAKENAAVLQKAGVSVNDAALYLAHFLGPSGAIAVLKASAGTPLSSLLSASQIAANQRLLGNGQTAGGLLADVQSRFPGGSGHLFASVGPGAGLSGGIVPAGAPGAPVTKKPEEPIPPDEEAVKAYIQRLDMARDAVKGFFSDLISGLREGASLADTLGKAFDNLASKAIDDLLQQLVDLALGKSGTAGAGLLGTLLNFSAPAGRALGGPIDPGIVYRVHKDELIVPRTPGMVIPRMAAMAGRGSPVEVNVRAHPSRYLWLETDARAGAIAGRGDVRTLNTARKAYPSTAASFAKLGTTGR